MRGQPCGDGFGAVKAHVAPANFVVISPGKALAQRRQPRIDGLRRQQQARVPAVAQHINSDIALGFSGFCRPGLKSQNEPDQPHQSEQDEKNTLEDGEHGGVT